MRDSVSASSILNVASAGARALLVLFLSVDLVLMLANLDRVYEPLPSIAAMVIVAIAAILLTLPAPEPLPIGRSLVIIAATTVVTVLVNWNVAPEFAMTYATWHFGANTLVLLVLGLRGRTVIAWIGFAALVLVTVIWSLQRGTPDLLWVLPNQVGTLVVGTLFAVGLRRTSQRISAMHTEQAAIASAESAAMAAAAERARQAEHLNAVARPALERIAAGPPYPAEERAGWMRLEASVRDSLRAPALSSLEMTAATDSARARGIEVNLLDDSAGTLESDADRSRVANAIISELDGMEHGRLTGRALPSGRGVIATILVDDGTETRRVDIE